MALSGVQAYILSKKYTEDTADALGAVKGAPCTIASVTETDNNITVVFSWTGTDGKQQTSTINIPKSDVNIESITEEELQRMWEQ